MKSLLLAVLAIVAMCVAVPSVQAHHGNDFARGFNAGARAARSGSFHNDDFARGFNAGAAAARGHVPRGNANFFNQNGGRNRFGFRR